MCEDYAELLRCYRKAVASYNNTLDAVESARPTASKADYERLMKDVEQAHSKVEDAANQLKAHIADHNCVPVAQAAKS